MYLPPDVEPPNTETRAMLIVLLIVLLAFLIVVFFLKPAHAETSYPANLYQGLIVEACGEGYDGMYAVACVVKNRLNVGLNHGLCGLKKRGLDEFVRKQGAKIERVAKDIVRKVFEQNGEDITKGATHYENIEAFGTPYWAKSMVKTIKIKHHTFFAAKR